MLMWQRTEKYQASHHQIRSSTFCVVWGLIGSSTTPRPLIPTFLYTVYNQLMCEFLRNEGCFTPVLALTVGVYRSDIVLPFQHF